MYDLFNCHTYIAIFIWDFFFWNACNYRDNETELSVPVGNINLCIIGSYWRTEGNNLESWGME